jgi:hypothetical protein
MNVGRLGRTGLPETPEYRSPAAGPDFIDDEAI